MTAASTNAMFPAVPAQESKINEAHRCKPCRSPVTGTSNCAANDLRANCNQMKKDAGDMLKARLVTVAPQAHEKALHLGADLMFFYEGGCKRRRDARSVYHL